MLPTDEEAGKKEATSPSPCATNQTKEPIRVKINSAKKPQQLNHKPMQLR